MDDLIERLRAATMGFDWSDLPDDAVIPAVPLLREAATALSQEREERDEWQRRAERAENALPGEVERRAHVSYVIWLEASLAEAKRLLKEVDAENARLLAVIKKAEDDIDIARFGEGYGFNLPYVVDDLRKALRPSQTAVAEDWQQNNEHGGYPIVVQLPGNAITRMWRKFAARFLSQEPNHER